VPILHWISREHYAMHATQLFIDRSSVPHAYVECTPGMDTFDKKRTLIKLIANFFRRVLFSCFPWYCVYRVALRCDKFWACLDL